MELGIEYIPTPTVLPTIILMVENVPSLASSIVPEPVLNNGVCGRKAEDSTGDTKVVLEKDSNCSSSKSMDSFDFNLPLCSDVNREFCGVWRYFESPYFKNLLDR